jgi:Domain of unknown function (DUF4136)
MKTNLRLIVTGALLIAGCGATVNSSVTPGTNLAQFKSFSFYTAPSGAAQPTSVADQTIDDALRQSLIAKGYVEATNGAPDFLVAHHVKTQQQLEVAGGYGYGFGFGGMDAYTYTEGTLIVDFIDPKTNKAFWRGTASDVVNHPSNPDTGRIQAAITKLINQYPTNLAATPRTNM